MCVHARACLHARSGARLYHVDEAGVHKEDRVDGELLNKDVLVDLERGEAISARGCICVSERDKVSGRDGATGWVPRAEVDGETHSW